MRTASPRSSRLGAVAALLLLPFAAGAQPNEESAPPCPPDPVSVGQPGRPNTNFDFNEYMFCHSSTNLQGFPAREKFAAGLFWNPQGNFGDFSSVLIVNNPNPSATATVVVDFLSEAGVVVQSTTTTVAPNGTHIATAAPLALATPPGRGSARIRSNIPIVGATLHHADQIFVPYWGLNHSPHAEVAYQQIQAPQDSTELHWGPIPVSNWAPGSLMGAAPVMWVMNPNPAPNTVTISYTHAGAPYMGMPTTTVVLPPFGSLFDTELWKAVNLDYYAHTPASAPPVYLDRDVVVTVQADLPILGDGMIIDALGQAPFQPYKLQLGGEFRMISCMLSGHPSGRLINPELTSVNGLVSTIMGVMNAGPNPTGPVLIEYFDGTNPAPIAQDVHPSLAPGGTLRIGRYAPATPNFPSGPVWDGWVRITTSCAMGALCGWTARSIFDSPTPTSYGEELIGCNGAEPGTGTVFADLGTLIRRKVAPVERVWAGLPNPPLDWHPGYLAIVNTAESNAGQYMFRFFEARFGVPSVNTDLTNYDPCLQPFGGLPFAATALTYIDKDPAPLGCGGGDTVGTLPAFATTTVSGRVDRLLTATASNPYVCDGINVLGDLLHQYFPGSNFPHSGVATSN